MAKKPKWTPFERVTLKVPDWVRGTDGEAAAIARQAKAEVYQNSRYRVEVKRQKPSPDSPELIELSIRNLENTAAAHDWRDFQRIKNEIAGPEEEAVELFPAESRLVDTANQYYIFVVKGVRWPFGFGGRMVCEKADPRIGGAQRPFEDDARPKDLVYLTPEMLAKGLAQEYFDDKQFERRSKAKCTCKDDPKCPAHGLKTEDAPHAE